MDMKDLPWPPLPAQGSSETIDYTLTEDIVLTDEAWSAKRYVLAKKGEVIKLRHCPNYGLVIHPEHGLFRY